MKIVYKITYPNGKIYVGKDATNSINYFGSAAGKLIEADFSPAERARFTITREVLWSSETASARDLHAKETAFIVALQANHPGRGYNRRPAWKSPDAP